MCLSDHDEIYVRGANAVCEPPLGSSGVALWATTLAALAVAAFLLGARGIHGRLRALATVLVLLGAAAPGLAALAFERPSLAPTAERLAAAEHAVRDEAGRRPVDFAGCEACFPVVELATVDRRPSEGAPFVYSQRAFDATTPRELPPFTFPWRALVVLAAAAVVGGVAFRWAGARADSGLALGLAARALVALTAFAATSLQPLLGVVMTALLLLASIGARHERALPVRTDRWPLVVGLVLVGIALARPPFPAYWDELVWLAKARAAASEPFDFVARALGPTSDLMPRGYPLYSPLLTAALALESTDAAALFGSQLAMSLVAMWVFLALVARLDTIEPQAHRLRFVLLILACTPLVWVHWRSAYIDLRLGLFAASLALALRLESFGDGIGRPVAVALAALLPGLKDEGIVYVVAVLGAHVFMARGLRSTLVLASLGALVSFGGFRLTLALHGGSNPDHSVVGLATTFASALPSLAARHASDVTTWGALPWLALVGSVVTLRSDDRGARTWAASLLTLVVALAGSLLVGPDRFREFALSGTLLNRMGIQLAPLASLVIVEALAMRATAPRRGASDAARQQALVDALAGTPRKARVEGSHHGSA